MSFTSLRCLQHLTVRARDCTCSCVCPIVRDDSWGTLSVFCLLNYYLNKYVAAAAREVEKVHAARGPPCVSG